MEEKEGKRREIGKKREKREKKRKKEEKERKIAELENELDGLYDSYQERLKERDAKYRVKEARRKDKEREEWHAYDHTSINHHKFDLGRGAKEKDESPSCAGFWTKRH